MKSNGVNLTVHLRKIPHLSLISGIAARHKVQIWLVGGLLRDIYLKRGKAKMDFDFCVERKTFSVAKELARRISAKFIILDEDQESARVILKLKNKIYTYDFTLMRGQNLAEDLGLRDFSINTLAVNLREKGAKLIDYYGARKDLRAKRIRIIKEEVLLHDPLRILRGFTFAGLFDSRIDRKTLALLARFKSSLKRVSRERINEEIFKIFALGSSFRILKIMDRLKIIDEIIPHLDAMRAVSQGAYHHLDVWQHSLETLKQFELLYRNRLKKNKDIYSYLNEDLANARSRIQIVKLACILHDIGKPFAMKKKSKKTIFHTHEKIGRDLAEDISKSLRLSLREKEILKKLIFWHLRPGYLADQITPSRRAVYRFFRDCAKEGVGVILLSLADWRATRGPKTSIKKRRRHERIMLKLVADYFKEQKDKPLPKVVDGYDIMRKFRLKSSPLVGKILKKVAEEQSLGKISNKTEAYRLAKKILDV